MKMERTNVVRAVSVSHIRKADESDAAIRCPYARLYPGSNGGSKRFVITRVTLIAGRQNRRERWEM